MIIVNRKCIKYTGETDKCTGTKISKRVSCEIDQAQKKKPLTVHHGNGVEIEIV